MSAALVEPAKEGERLLRLPEVLKRFPVSRSTWWAGVKSGRYPASVKIGPYATAWRETDINRLVNPK